MVCMFRYCMYEKDCRCTLPKIEIGQNGECAMARHVMYNQYNSTPEMKEKIKECKKEFNLR